MKKRITVSKLLIPLAILFSSNTFAEYYMVYTGPGEIVSTSGSYITRSHHYGCHHRYHHYSRWHRVYYNKVVFYETPYYPVYYGAPCCGGGMSSNDMTYYGYPSYTTDDHYLNHFFTATGSDTQLYFSDYNQVKTPETQSW